MAKLFCDLALGDIKTMKTIRIIGIITVVIAMLVGFNKYLFSWGLFNLFSNTTFTSEELEKIEAFDPDKDILYLPALDKNSDIFHSIKDLSICRKKAVRKYIYIYLTRGREYVKRSIERSYLSMDIINDVFEKNKDIPKEIAILPLLESGYNPHAVSRSNAVGLWQFVSNTSGPLGLKVNQWVDERRNIEKSTEAALRHLRNLHRRFKSWDLALAAYNGGGGYISRAIKKTGAKNIWELRDSGVLRKETHEYVPRYIALVLIYKNQGLFEIKDEITEPKQHETTIVHLKYSVELKNIANISGTSIDNIRKLNPDLKQNIIPLYNKRYDLRMPKKAGEQLIENRHKLNRYRISRIIRYRVRKGECLSVIARRHKKKLLHLSGLTA